MSSVSRLCRACLCCCRRRDEPQHISEAGLEREMEVLVQAVADLKTRTNRAKSTLSTLKVVVVLYALLWVGLDVFFFPGWSVIMPHLPVVAAAFILPLVFIALISVHARRSLRQFGQKSEEYAAERTRLINLIKDELPMKVGLPLLRKYDPNGNHKMILPSPVQEAEISRLRKEHTQLLRVIDTLIDVRLCDACSQFQSSTFVRLKGDLAPFKSELRNYGTAFGTSLDQRIIRALTPGRAAGGGAAMSAAQPRRARVGGQNRLERGAATGRKPPLAQRTVSKASEVPQDDGDVASGRNPPKSGVRRRLAMGGDGKGGPGGDASDQSAESDAEPFAENSDGESDVPASSDSPGTSKKKDK